MKKKKPYTKPFLLTAVLLGTTTFCHPIPILAENLPDYNYLQTEEYLTYSNVLADRSANYPGNTKYALYDMDEDGIREMIISYGNSLADWKNDVYTLSEGKYVSMIGSFSSDSLLYKAPDGNGIYAVSGIQMVQNIDHITKSGDQLTTENIEKRTLSADEEYTSYPDPIPLVSLPGSYEVMVTAPDGGVNIRSGAGTEYEQVLPDMIPNSDILTITQQASASNGNSWGYTTYKGVSGWVALTQVTSLETTGRIPFPSIYSVQVTAPDGGVNMRSGAGTEYEQVLSSMIPNGTVLSISLEATASNGNTWGFTTYNGVSGWIALTQITRVEPSEESAPLPVARHVVNCSESITLRTSPDVNAAEICQIPLGATVQTIDDSGNEFLTVMYQGFTGYCLREYLSEPINTH